MLIQQMNWMQVETYLRHDDRVVLPLGSTEQHAYLSLMTDTILAQKVAQEAAEPLGVPVMPALPFGMAPYFTAYPGTISLKSSTYFAVVQDLIESLYRTGFRRLLLVNGHGGNSPVLAVLQEWLNQHDDVRIKLHNWWAGSQVMAEVTQIDPVASHASWMENFPWTRIAGVKMPSESKEMIDLSLNRQLNAKAVRDYVGDGNYGGAYVKDDEAMLKIWQAGVLETRTQIETGWAS